jgi:hypothetical protein
MKKITFILLALISGTAFAQNNDATDKATAEALAEIVQPLTVDSNNNLIFGRIIGSDAGGKVTINPIELTREFTNNNMKDPSDTDFSAAKFTIDAAKGYSYSVIITGDENLADEDGNGGPAMPISYTAALDGVSLSLDDNATGSESNQVLTIGGELTVNGGQAQSNYKGDISVTVTYN